MPGATVNPTGSPQKLNQILSVEKAAKGKFEATLNDFYFKAKKPDFFYGHVKKHTPKVDGDEVKPTDTKIVQVKAREIIDQLKIEFAKFFDLLAQKEATSCEAKADVIYREKTWAHNVPVMTLVSMEKQIAGQILPLIRQVPILSSDEDWKFSTNQALYITDPKKTFSKKVIKKPLELAKATEKHQAQVQLVDEEVITGWWDNVFQSSAFSKTDVDRWEASAVDLLEAVKFARQNAAQTQVRGDRLGTKMMETIFAAAA